MGFDDLPDDWPSLPLREPRLVADVLDLIVSAADRQAGAVAVLVCDGSDRLVQPVVVSDIEVGASGEDRERMFRTLVEVTGGDGALLVAIARRDGLSITSDDRAWCRAAHRACADRARLLGVHVITMTGSREVPAAATAA